MATGYDNRQSGRQSFALDTSAPAQGRGTKAAQGVRLGTSGGNSQGGVVNATSQTDISSAPQSNIPTFLEQLAEPMIKARQQQKFFEGAAVAAQGIAVDEIARTQPAWANVFGPNYYVQGAGMYKAQETTATINTALTSPESLDALKRMDPASAGAHISETIQGMLTGSVQTDNIIQANMLERTGPIMALVAQERVAWQQQEVVRAQGSSWQAGAVSFEQSARAFAQMQEPGDEAMSGMAQSRRNFLAQFVPPAGQTEESYTKSLYDNAMQFMQDGNFYAYTAMQGSGALGLLKDEDRLALDRRYETLSNAKMEDAAATLGPELFKLDANIAMASGANSTYRPIDAANDMMGLNDRIRRMTGIDRDYFDIDEQRRGVGSVATQIIRRMERAEDAQIRKQERAETREEEAAAKADADARLAVTARTLVASGAYNAALADGGIPQNDLDAAAWAIYNGPDKPAAINTLVLNNQRGGTVITPIANAMRARVTANVPGGYDAQSFQDAYHEWSSFANAQGGVNARAAYYGDQDRTMLAMDSLIKGGTPGLLAFAQTFGAGGYRANVTLDKAGKTAISQAIKEEGPDWLARTFGGQREFNSSAVDLLTNAISAGYTTRMSASPGIAPRAAAAAELNTLLGNHSLEIVGGFAWFNSTENKTPLNRLTGLDDRSLGDAWEQTVKSGFEASGFSPQDRYVVLRNNDANGRVAFTVTGFRDDGDSRTIVVRPEDLIRRNTQTVQAARTRLETQEDTVQRIRAPNAFSPEERERRRDANTIDPGERIFERVQ